MQAGSVLVDLAASSLGGNVEGSVADQAVLTGDGVRIIGAGNLPAQVPTAASTAYSHNIVALLAELVRDGALTIDPADEIQAGVVVTHQGTVVHPAVAALLGSPAAGRPSMTTGLMSDIYMFVLAILVGYEVITKVPSTLHTPLMSASNAIHGIVIIGAIITASQARTTAGYVLAFVAAFFAGDERGGRLQPDRPDAADVPQAARSGRPRRRLRPARGEVMNAVSIAVALAYLLAAAGFVVALHLMNSPATARRGSRLSWLGMIVAVAAALVSVIHDAHDHDDRLDRPRRRRRRRRAAGLVMARRVKMTDVPQVVSIFNAVGGGAAALVAAGGFVRLAGEAGISTQVMIATVLDIIIGPVTFSGSLIAAGKLQGWVSSRPVVFPGARLVTAALAVIGVGASCYLLAGHDSIPVLILVTCAALGFGVTMTMPIGGADMPVVIALLNSFTGIAVAIAGFVIDNGALIIGGALVGASGGILTLLMARAMNRSVLGVMMGGFGTGDSGPVGGPAAGAGASVRSISAEDAAIQLAYASKVVIVPGYGLAAAQAQHEAAELAAVLRRARHGVLRHPPGGRPDARPHERAAGRGERAL